MPKEGGEKTESRSVPITVLQAIARPKALSRKIEFGLVFFALPALVVLSPWLGLPRVPFWIALPLLGLICSVTLLMDKSFDRSQLWNAKGAWRGLPAVIGLWLVGVVVLTAMVRIFSPETFLDFPRQRPALWLFVMFAYPVLSVFLQNIIYRAFIFHRYRNAFRTPDHMIWASALAFCFAHVIFLNLPVLTLTMAGGLIFAYTYHKRHSLLLCSIEHALYGCTLFTIGLGRYLVHGQHMMVGQ